MTAGGIPDSGSFLELELGFSELPRISFHHAVERGFSVGGSIALDYAYSVPADAFTFGLMAAVPIRYSLVQLDTMTLVFDFEPGLYLGLERPVTLGLALGSGIAVGFAVEHRLVIGGGVDLPLLLAVPLRSRGAYASLPILIGPTAEFHPTPSSGVTLEAKLGPSLNSDLGSRFSLRMLLGFAYRL